MRTLFKYLKPYLGRMSLGFFIKVSGTLAELMLPYILSHILKKVVSFGSVKMILFWGSIMLICAGVALVCNIVANRMAAAVSRYFSEAVRHDLFSKTLHLSSAQTDRFTIASLESRITSDTYNIHQFVGMMQRMGVRAPILLIGGISITLFMDSFLALGMIALLPFIFVTIYFISSKGVPLYTKVQQSVDGMIRVVREDVQGIRVIKALSKDKYEHKRYDDVNKALVKDEKRAGTIMGSVNPIMTLLMNAGLVLVISMSASRVANHTSDPETVIAFMQYFTQISMAMMTVTRMFVMYTKSSASAKRIAEVLNCDDELIERSESLYPRKYEDMHIAFDNVGFSYNGRKNDLENISFSLKKGQSLGIIGATGSGKSTVLRLLLRFYDVSLGGIYVNGRDVRTVKREQLYSFFGVALQNDFLYADTIEENIRFGREISKEKIIEAAKIAQADSFINEFEDGYDHLLSPKGTNISGGQKQRLFIARAIAAEPEILILDDSTSALDYRTELELRRALNEKFSDTTVITVAQRVSAVKNCDLILVLDNGKIIGSGTHDQLMDSCIEYQEISNSQLGGAFVD
ncbi:MAG: ABC transporter ATP-binding protein [Clostridia bacterium]|nr:ABC transporter ATP-binding protein [Clostridia bacterium]MBO5913100.1 ABC transporter ATP-binding protein [Clostridia bacterium]